MALQSNGTPVSASLRITVLALLFSLFLNQISLATAIPTLIFEDNFDIFNTSTWQHLITAWRGNQSQFQRKVQDESTKDYELTFKSVAHGKGDIITIRKELC
ncbi:hypothetical protein OUZ56_005965 [Daphnia magna]|uniref:Uncharacterized protein n=1 Tax=Daphnia magna TaxID=35525 RepID=A0ABQ9YU87_9CRUS|nr:hypothetical protein OUZ56_005965 [Daphnia magna]